MLSMVYNLFFKTVQNDVDNLMTYFHLPEYFRPILQDNQNKFDYSEFVTMHNLFTKTEDVSLLVPYLQKLLKPMCLIPLENKQPIQYPTSNQIIALFLFTLFETTSGKLFLNQNIQIKTIAREKYIEFSTSRVFPEFSEYFKHTFNTHWSEKPARALGTSKAHKMKTN